MSVRRADGGEETLHFDHAILATGSVPAMPPALRIDDPRVMDSTAALDLWHVKAIIRALADGKTKLRGVDLKDEKSLDNLMAETESLYETVNKNKEEIKALIEFHINFKSFEMNKLLKLLAIVSFSA